MRRSYKKKAIILLAVIWGVLSIVRIVYVNSKQHVDGTHTYKTGETFEYKNFQVRAAEVNCYSADDMKEIYQEIPEDVLPENEIVIRLEVKNLANEEQIFNISSFTTQVGIERGSAIDPYVYPYLNPELSGSIALQKGEMQTVLLAFPIERSTLETKEQIKLILSLYPEKCEILFGCLDARSDFVISFLL